MFSYNSMSEVRGASSRPVFLPGEPEPRWLYRNARNRRDLAQIKREQQPVQATRPRLVQKLRLVFARG